MDVFEEVQPLWTYLRKCNHYGRTCGSEILMDVIQEVKTLWTYLRKCNPDGRT